MMNGHYIEYLGEPYDGERAYHQRMKWLAFSPDQKSQWHKDHPPFHTLDVMKRIGAEAFQLCAVDSMNEPSSLLTESEWRT